MGVVKSEGWNEYSVSMDAFLSALGIGVVSTSVRLVRMEGDHIRMESESVGSPGLDGATATSVTVFRVPLVEAIKPFPTISTAVKAIAYDYAGKILLFFEDEK